MRVEEHENVNALRRFGFVAAPPQTALIDGPGIAAGPFIESFRLLAMNLNRLLEEVERRSILVVSGLPGDGRSLTAMWLARALAEISSPVLLVDADPVGSGSPAPWRRSLQSTNGNGSSHPVIGSSSPFEVDGQQGLYTYLPQAGKRAQSAFLGDVIDTLGHALAEGMAAVVDTPACLHSTVAFGLAPHVGGVLYVARPYAGHRPPHLEIRNQLDLLGANVLGVVVNEG
jgi:Mrp family chromosome partitioning ATPase